MKHACQEIINNVIEHSNSPTLGIIVTEDYVRSSNNYEQWHRNI